MKSGRILSLTASVMASLCVPALAAAPPSATAVVGSDGTLVRGIAVTGAAHVDTGVYTVTFTSADVPTACAYTASVGSPDQGVSEPLSLVNVGASDTAGTIQVYTYDKHAVAADRPFAVYVAC